MLSNGKRGKIVHLALVVPTITTSTTHQNSIKQIQMTDRKQKKTAKHFVFI